MAGHAHLDHGGDKPVALLISVLALCLALVETGANSAQTEVFTRNVESANLWSFCQGVADGAVRAAIEAQQKAWRDTAARWESEPDTGEGRRELSERARAAEAARQHAMGRYHLYEYSAAAFQVAIVVASSSVVVGVRLLAGAGVLLGIVGLALGALGWLAPGAVHL